MTILSNVDYFKELPFFNASNEKPKIIHLKNVDVLAELPFYDQINIIKQIKHLKDMQDHIKLK